MGKRRKSRGKKEEDGDNIDDLSDADPNTVEFYHDAVDQFHADRDKVLIDAGVKANNKQGHSSDEEQEVLGVGGESDSEDDAEFKEYEQRLHTLRSKGFKEHLPSDSDEEKEDEEEGIATKAWGKSAAKFYGGEDSDEGEMDADVDADLLEEEEALAIQKKLRAQLDESDIGLDIFQPIVKKSTEVKSEGKIKKDLSKLSKKEKLKLLKKESPELIDLMKDFKMKLNELQKTLLPIHSLITENKLPSSKAADFIKTKVQLYLNYCVNLSFYLMLKAKQTPVQNHPVVNRLVQYRNLIQQLNAVGDKMQEEMDFILEKIENGEEIPIAEPQVEPARIDAATFVQRKMQKTVDKKKKKKRVVENEEEEEEEEEMEVTPAVPTGGRSWGRKKAPMVTEDEKLALDYYRMMKEGRKGSEEVVEEMAVGEEREAVGGQEGEDGEEEGRRAINYQMAKNKGLTRQRKKEYRNPRVRYRSRFKDAVKRRRGQVRPVRKELAPYAGEIRGIRAGVKKSVTFVN
ncbi:hypothetical protein CAPTEDRAFT_21928 [Capitella teleta]|uniref:Sas10 C-terminal domain-containing protein n=1 Tax=Capitella teleta TaxID=283909 RepID=R7TAH4_CAPTE|nr:hypothetical protein CAPTEDRAFT_21928 [Capitella teleta]|eukprot:ELT90709.1 hypothetical protein CAPTEDRAFT_21928 [Capitella teleta]